MKTTQELAQVVYRLAAGTVAPENFVTWFTENVEKFNLSESDYVSISRTSLNKISDLAEESGFTF